MAGFAMDLDLNFAVAMRALFPQLILLAPPRIIFLDLFLTVAVVDITLLAAPLPGTLCAPLMLVLLLALPPPCRRRPEGPSLLVAIRTAMAALQARP